MKKALLIFVVLLLMLFGLKQSLASFCSHTKYYFMQTGLLSDDYFSLIKNHIQSLSENSTAHVLIDSIKKEFPLVDKINIAYRPCGSYVMIYAHKPVCCINDNVVLTCHNEIFLKDHFSSPIIDSIAYVTVSPECLPKIVSLLSPLLHELPFDFYETYNLELSDEHCVHLTDKQEKYFTILLSANQKNISSLLAHCNSVKKNITERKGFKKEMQWIADVRFNDYVVVYKV